MHPMSLPCTRSQPPLEVAGSQQHWGWQGLLRPPSLEQPCILHVLPPSAEGLSLLLSSLGRWEQCEVSQQILMGMSDGLAYPIFGP